MLLPLLAVFTADNEHIFTVTLDLSVQACKNTILSLANVAYYMLHAVQCRVDRARVSAAESAAGTIITIITFETMYTLY